MKFIDTHCHIHDSEFADRFQMTPKELVADSLRAGIDKFICVGTDYKSSVEALELASECDECHYSIALHPHEAENRTLEDLQNDLEKLGELAKKNQKKLVAIGETGLDYYYHETDVIKSRQKELLKTHIELAKDLNVPLIFHVREAFEDFFTIIDEYENITGVVHSFSASKRELDGVIKRGLYVGLNGIMTFTRDDKQTESAKIAPTDKILLETDAPFLTPTPFRGKVCKPKHVVCTAEFLSDLRGEKLSEFAKKTSENARTLFSI